MLDFTKVRSQFEFHNPMIDSPLSLALWLEMLINLKVSG